VELATSLDESASGFENCWFDWRFGFAGRAGERQTYMVQLRCSRL